MASTSTLRRANYDNGKGKDMTDLIQRYYDNQDTENKCLFDHRAAILEYEGKYPRYVAERLAQRYIAKLIREARNGSR